ncbi:glycosyltransferase, partial [Intestinibacter sp.]
KPYGIPVEKSFLEHREKSVVLEELGLAPDKFTVLLMGGSFGAGNIKDTLKELLEIDRDFQIIVITGRNETLKEKLEKSLEKYTIDKNISILGFTQDMNDILSAVDIIVSKPGGLTTTECLLKELPMIIPYYIPGQEEENMDFLSNCGAALRTSKKFTISVLLKVLIDNPTRMELLKNNIKSIKKQNTAEDIANLVSNILGY